MSTLFLNFIPPICFFLLLFFPKKLFSLQRKYFSILLLVILVYALFFFINSAYTLHQFVRVQSLSLTEQIALLPEDQKPYVFLEEMSEREHTAELFLCDRSMKGPLYVPCTKRVFLEEQYNNLTYYILLLLYSIYIVPALLLGQIGAYYLLSHRDSH